MRHIPLSGKRGAGLRAIVDDEDYEHLSKFKWYLVHGYARRNEPRSETNVPTRMVSMHREILGLVFGDEVFVDHRNRNGLDNRRKNLRTCTSSENPQNMPPLGGKSQYRGVHRHTHRPKWIAQAQHGGKTKHLGCFDDELDAARAARDFRLAHMPFTIEPEIPEESS